MKTNNIEDSIENNNTFIVYNGLLQTEIRSICEMFCVIQATVLSMIKNAAFVLPNDSKNNIKSYNLPKKLSQLAKNGTINSHDIQYTEPMTTKDILLCSIKNLQRKQLLEKLISKVTASNDGVKIRITIKKSGFQKLNTASQAHLKNDVAIMEQIINAVNSRFLQLLPDAKQKAKKLMAQLENSSKKIPATARFETMAASKKNF